MRSILSLDEFTPADAKPKELYRRFVELTFADVRELLLKQPLTPLAACPACQSQDRKPAFEKAGMHYEECGQCNSLFINPRPDDAAVLDYYTRSGAEQFWHENLSPASDEFRKKKIVEPRVGWLLNYACEMPGDLHVVDVHPHQDGWVEVLASLKQFARKTVVHPLVQIAPETQQGYTRIDQPFSDVTLDAPADVITLFEVVDRTADLDKLFQSIARNLKPNGFCLITSILASGFDLQMLWDRSENLFPPDRLNVLTVEGFESLFNRYGLDVVEFSTPGRFDVELALQSLKSHPDMELPRFLSYLFKHRSAEVRDAFQQFLQAGLLSSSGRMVLRKR